MSNSQIATRIKQICKEKNITISQLLEKCEIRKSLIYDLEKRDYTPSIAIINAIADYLNVSVDYLLGRTDEPNTIGINSVNSADKETTEITKMINSLSLVDRAKVVLFIDELKNKQQVPNSPQPDIQISKMSSEFAIARGGNGMYKPLPTDEQMESFEEVTPDMI